MDVESFSTVGAYIPTRVELVRFCIDRDLGTRSESVAGGESGVRVPSLYRDRKAEADEVDAWEERAVLEEWGSKFEAWLNGRRGSGLRRGGLELAGIMNFLLALSRRLWCRI